MRCASVPWLVGLMLASNIGAAPLVVGHRGTGADSDTNPYSENSLPSLVRAFEEGADIVEVDAQITWLKKPILWHDKEVDTGFGEWPCRRLLHPFHFPLLVGPTGMVATVPSLRDALRTAKRRAPGHRVLDIELKVYFDEDREPLVAAVAEVLREEKMASRVLITSFDLEAVKLAEAMLPGLESGHLGVGSYATLGRVKKANQQGHQIEWVIPSRHFETDSPLVVGSERERTPGEEFLRASHEAGLRAGLWVVNDVGDLRRFTDLGYDMFITDAPDVAREVVDAAP